MPTLPRLLALFATLGLLAACDTNNLKDPPTPMGDFAMGLNVVVADTSQTVPFSRKATPDEWKEAMTKALGTGFRFGVHFTDIGVVNAPAGRPTVALTGGAARHLAHITPEGYVARIDLTLTDEYPLAEAVVIISAIPTRDSQRG